MAVWTEDWPHAIEQYYANSIYGPRILRRIVPLFPFLSRIRLLRSPGIMLWSLCAFLVLHATLSLRCTRSTLTKGILPCHSTEALALAAHLVCEMLWRRSWMLEDSTKRVDMVQRDLDWHLSILFHTSHHDYSRCYHAGIRQILWSFFESCIFSCLGEYFLSSISSMITNAQQGSCYWIYCSLDCHVLLDSVLRPGEQGHGAI